MSGHDVQALIYTTLSMTSDPVYQPLSPFSSVIYPSLNATPSIGTTPPLTSSVDFYSSANTSIELVMAKKLVVMEVMIQQIPGVPNSTQKESTT